MIGAVLQVLLAAAGCDAIDRTDPDEALAAVYAAVAQEEERLGALTAAAAAWRSAAALSIPGGVCDLALSRVCGEAQARLDFEAGLERFKAGDCHAALPRMQAARSGTETTAAALLEGICDYELGDDASAITALEAAHAMPELQGTADLYLGLVALRRGDDPHAAQKLHAAAQGPTEGLRSLAAELLATVDTHQRLKIEGSIEGGYDSNATQLAYATALPGGGNDGFGAATVGAHLHPWGTNGPFLSVGGGYRKYVRLAQSDVGLGTGSVGWQLATQRTWASLDYGVDFISVGATPWLLRNRGTARLLLAIDRFAVSAEYVLGYDALQRIEAQGYTGFRHSARLAVAIRLGAHTLELSGLLIRSLAVAVERASVEPGAELRWTVRPGARWELSLAAGARVRNYDAVDADLGVARAELQLDGQLRADFELTQNLALFALVEDREVFANVAALSYTRVSGSAGIRLGWGVW